MRPIADDKIEAFEEAAMESVKQVRAFFKYEGTNPTYFQKARLGTGVISAYARIRASETNRMAVEMAMGKLAPAPTSKALKA